MNANKQDAGGLPELPAWMDDYKIPCDAFDGSEDVRLSDRMRAYGELCRAAPGGGDAEVVRLRQLLAGTQEQFRVVSELLERNQAHHERMMKLMDSAPAGSGEVEDGCTESNCERCATAPHARGELRHAGIGSYPDVTHIADKAAWLERAASKWEVGPMAINPADALRLRELAALLRKLQQGAEHG